MPVILRPVTLRAVTLRPATRALAAPFCLAASLLMTTTALADLRVIFEEGAPKDTFRIENTGACDLTGTQVQLDLAGSAGGLIFDVTGSGAGVQVFQPFEIVEGRDALRSVPAVVDGQTRLELDIVSLAPGDAVAFTIDVDDTKGQRATMITGAEIAGAYVAYIRQGAPVRATFSTKSVASLPVKGC